MKKLLYLFLLPVWTLCGTEPILRVGVTTDTHIGQTAESCNHVRKAFEIFKDQKADLIVHCGDLADKHYPAGYRHYRNIFNEVFGDRKPAELFVYAGHDAMGFKNVDEAYAIMKKEIGATNDLYDKRVLKGYPFLVFRQVFDPVRYENDIAQAEKDFPGKPIFVFNHEPPLNTTYHSLVWGSAKVRKILEKHPRVVQFSGHAHSSVRDERNIWQGKFTSISAGCLQRWGGLLTGSPTFGKRESDGVLLMEIYPEKLIIRRFEYTTGREYGADKRWIVPLPFDEKTAPYSPERRYAEVPAPEFPAGAAIRQSWQNLGLNIQFPEASDGVAGYRIALDQKTPEGWHHFARRDIHSGFYLHRKPANQTVLLDRGYFESGKTYRITVTPVTFWQKGGKALEAEFTAPQFPEANVVFQSLDPMKEIPFQVIRKNTDVPVKDGFYQLKTSSNLQIPESIWEGPAKTSRFRLTVDFEMRQTETQPWVIMVLDPRNNACVSTRIGTVPGRSGKMRYSLEFPKHAADARYVIQFRYGAPAQVNFSKVRVERTR
ncbi:MAG: metallophosphoesterase [Lentisphaeria bacterium]|nr:metallophosphoesterase [Lentisphaeria bacterium]